MSLEHYYSNADVIFTATIRERFKTCSMFLADDSVSCAGGSALSRVDIGEIYKDPYGSLERSRAGGVLIATGGSVEDIPAIEGNRYLLFGQYAVGNIIAVPTCQGSSSFTYAREVIVRLQQIEDAFDGNAP